MMYFGGSQRRVQMRWLIIAGCAALGGCATAPLDETQIASANAAIGLATDQCEDGVRSGAFPIASAFIHCIVVARRQYFATLKFNKMEIFDAYATRVEARAARLDRDEITIDQFATDFDALSREMITNISTSIVDQRADGERQAQAVRAFGAALQRGAAGFNASRTGALSIQCASQRNGSGFNATCTEQ